MPVVVVEYVEVLCDVVGSDFDWCVVVVVCVVSCGGFARSADVWPVSTISQGVLWDVFRMRGV